MVITSTFFSRFTEFYNHISNKQADKSMVFGFKKVRFGVASGFVSRGGKFDDGLSTDGDGAPHCHQRKSQVQRSSGKRFWSEEITSRESTDDEMMMRMMMMMMMMMMMTTVTRMRMMMMMMMMMMNMKKSRADAREMMEMYCISNIKIRWYHPTVLVSSSPTSKLLSQVYWGYTVD